MIKTYKNILSNDLIENIFNRLVCYPSNLLHGPQIY